MNDRNSNSPLKRSGLLLCVLLLLCSFARPAAAQTRLIVRDSLGLSGIKLTCLLLGCNVVGGLGDPNGQLFLVVFPSALSPVTALLQLQLQTGVVDAEIDQIARTSAAYAGQAPSYLSDTKLVSYYGAKVWRGYITQTPNQLIQTASTQSTFNVAGKGAIVAVIDTGVDPNHPVLQPVLLAGYDFTRNTSGGSEMPDVNVSPTSSQRSPGQVNQSTVGVLDQSTVGVLDGTQQYSAFGHGTMTAGIVHLVAPQASIMPLKSFNANGTGYNSDILRAIYYAVRNGADVINMSFSFSTSSTELAKAVNYASSNGVISVASAGNDGMKTNVYPGSLPSVIDVASTNNNDIQSSFTNYGAPPIWIAAPGEAVMTTYPWATYAAGWGTSFSAPFASGAAALMLGRNGGCAPSKIASGLSHADWISDPDVGYGRLDTYLAVQSCR